MNKVRGYFLTQGCSLTKCLFVLGLFFLLHPRNYAQENRKDSLLVQINKLRSSQNFSYKDTLHIKMLNDLAQELRFYKVDSLLLLSQDALNHSKASGYNTGECRALMGLGDYYSDNGKHKKALLYYNSALSLSTKTQNKDLILESKDNLAGEYSYRGDYAKALSHYLEGIDMATEFGDKKMLSIMNENVANLYAAQKDYAQALIFYKKVKKFNEEIGNEVFSAETMSNIASIYADMNKLDYAMFNANSSITVFEKHQVMDWLAYAYEIKGKTYLKGQKYKWALHWYKQSEMLHQNLEDFRGEIDLLNGMAKAYFGLKKDSLAEVYALKAFGISERLKFLKGKQQCAETLYKVNKNKNDFSTALKYHEIYQTLSDTLTRSENRKSLTMLKTKMEHEKQKEDLIKENKKQLSQQRNYMYASLGFLLIFIVVSFLVHRSDKIQKKLNIELKQKTEDLELKQNELREINETKDKLFSIIGHDLRGPIGAFQGLLKLLKEGEVGQSEFMEFVPKLRHDIDHISFTLNNLLSWGQTQMNGSVTRPSLVNVESIVKENMHLLSEIAEKKSIKLSSQLSSNTVAWSDSDQIDIVIRNLMSNALKFTPNNGMVTISSNEMSHFWQISVRDTGVGIDQEIIQKLFRKKSNVTTYGTNNEKGTGLGLSLCKEMVEKNGGDIWVESHIRKGSTFHFTIPKAKKKYQQAG
ncbi:tetratricopeptide repeat-containing sensor histidine kinase [Pareuzebyella sediminis]|uniref:tetratricopeptide repeat-containing sensor histidine kinase n=1 Tax=Pareuzebyella sediminis TaxID=2607998 RepID=UPI0011EE2D80|nr:tetratricopeptide repeat-containing sensor histidine kinase [Pareuzebyella sediminis]